MSKFSFYPIFSLQLKPSNWKATMVDEFSEASFKNYIQYFTICNQTFWKKESGNAQKTS